MSDTNTITQENEMKIEAYKTIERPNLVVTYGSLLTGLSNSGVMVRADGELLGEGFIKEPATLYSLGGFPSLQLGRPSDNGSRVRVELYRVSEEGMKPLNRLEGHISQGHKQNFYDCSPVEVEMGNGEIVTALVYHIEREFDTIVESGDWRAFRNNLVANSGWVPDFS